MTSEFEIGLERGFKWAEQNCHQTETGANVSGAKLGKTLSSIKNGYEAAGFAEGVKTYLLSNQKQK